MDDWEFLIVLSKKVNAQELWQIVLQCEVEANPEPSIQWTWQGNAARQPIHLYSRPLSFYS